MIACVNYVSIHNTPVAIVLNDKKTVYVVFTFYPVFVYVVELIKKIQYYTVNEKVCSP